MYNLNITHGEPWPSTIEDLNGRAPEKPKGSGSDNIVTVIIDCGVSLHVITDDDQVHAYSQRRTYFAYVCTVAVINVGKNRC